MGEPAVRERAAPTAGAAARGERILATTAAVARLGGLVPLLAAVLSGHPPTRAAAAVLAAEAAASVLLVVGWLRRGRQPVGWAVADALGLAAVLVLTGTGALPGQLPGESPAYNLATIATIGLGLVPWSLPPALAAAALLAAANLTTALSAGSNYPTWNALPDSVTFLGITVLGWLLARLLRTSSAAVDRHHTAALRRAAALAEERERARQSEALGAQLLSTLDELNGAGGLGPDLRDQVRREADWLRAVVTEGLPDSGALGAALRGLVAEKAGGGMRIDLRLPETEPPVPAPVASALVEAAREALTNVVKHSGTRSATVILRTAGTDVVLEVSDTGRGFDPGISRARIGHTYSIRQRLTEVGGRAEIDSRPGSGTTVRLAAPVGAGVTGNG